MEANIGGVEPQAEDVGSFTNAAEMTARLFR